MLANGLHNGFYECWPWYHVIYNNGSYTCSNYLNVEQTMVLHNPIKLDITM